MMMNKKLLLIALLACTLNVDALSNYTKKVVTKFICHSTYMPLVSTLGTFLVTVNSNYQGHDKMKLCIKKNPNLFLVAGYAAVTLPLFAATEYLADKWFDEEDEGN